MFLLRHHAPRLHSTPDLLLVRSLAGTIDGDKTREINGTNCVYEAPYGKTTELCPSMTPYLPGPSIVRLVPPAEQIQQWVQSMVVPDLYLRTGPPGLLFLTYSSQSQLLNCQERGRGYSCLSVQNINDSLSSTHNFFSTSFWIWRLWYYQRRRNLMHFVRPLHPLLIPLHPRFCVPVQVLLGISMVWNGASVTLRRNQPTI